MTTGTNDLLITLTDLSSSPPVPEVSTSGTATITNPSVADLNNIMNKREVLTDIIIDIVSHQTSIFPKEPRKVYNVTTSKEFYDIYNNFWMSFAGVQRLLWTEIHNAVARQRQAALSFGKSASVSSEEQNNEFNNAKANLGYFSVIVIKPELTNLVKRLEAGCDKYNSELKKICGNGGAYERPHIEQDKITSMLDIINDFMVNVLGLILPLVLCSYNPTLIAHTLTAMKRWAKTDTGFLSDPRVDRMYKYLNATYKNFNKHDDFERLCDAHIAFFFTQLPPDRRSNVFSNIDIINKIINKVFSTAVKEESAALVDLFKEHIDMKLYIPSISHKTVMATGSAKLIRMIKTARDDL